MYILSDTFIILSTKISDMSKKIVIIGIILTIFIVFSAGCISIGEDNDELEKSLISSITG